MAYLEAEVWVVVAILSGGAHIDLDRVTPSEHQPVSWAFDSCVKLA